MPGLFQDPALDALADRVAGVEAEVEKLKTEDGVTRLRLQEGDLVLLDVPPHFKVEHTDRALAMLRGSIERAGFKNVTVLIKTPEMAVSVVSRRDDVLDDISTLHDTEAGITSAGLDPERRT